MRFTQKMEIYKKCVCKNKEFYSTTFLEKNDFTFTYLRVENKKLRSFFSTLSLHSYFSLFNKKPTKFDIHEKHFQDFVIRNFNGLKALEFKKSNLMAIKRFVRTRNYAISSREDLSWSGEFIEDGNAKLKEINEYKNSLKLYNWVYFKTTLRQSDNSRKCKISVVRDTTTNTVLNITRKYPGKKIAWLNLANAHHVCGAYSINIGGSQEEETATSSNACAILGTRGEFVNGSLKELVFGKSVNYKMGSHIPPGGNYFSKVKFLLDGNNKPINVDSYMIATAFADFRPKIPYVFKYSERLDYFDVICGKVKDEKSLENRLKFDIAGTLKTAVYEHIDVIVLGASGCGAFKHSPFLEAKMWKELLDIYSRYFDEVVFSIFDKKDSDNILAFSKLFA